jgi:phosphatidate cytidylyltransferase
LVGGPEDRRSTAALLLAIFVPKCGDIGAYFTGRLLGRHRMAPTLSPKKTWEGASGGVVASVLAAIGINCLGPLVRGGWVAAAALGAAVGIAGIYGDLAESLIKRDCGQKDASQVMPGFGGVLDVVDSILFAAPVAYWWITL